MHTLERSGSVTRSRSFLGLTNAHLWVISYTVLLTVTVLFVQMSLRRQTGQVGAKGTKELQKLADQVGELIENLAKVHQSTATVGTTQDSLKIDHAVTGGKLPGVIIRGGRRG